MIANLARLCVAETACCAQTGCFVMEVTTDHVTLTAEAPDTPELLDALLPVALMVHDRGSLRVTVAMAFPLVVWAAGRVVIAFAAGTPPGSASGRLRLNLMPPYYCGPLLRERVAGQLGR